MNTEMRLPDDLRYAMPVLLGWAVLLGWIALLQAAAGYRYYQLSLDYPADVPAQSSTDSPPNRQPPSIPQPSSASPTPSRPPLVATKSKSAPSPTPPSTLGPAPLATVKYGPPSPQPPMKEAPPVLLSKRLAVVVLSTQEIWEDAVWQKAEKMMKELQATLEADLLDRQVHVVYPQGNRIFAAGRDPRPPCFSITELREAVKDGWQFVADRVKDETESYAVVLVWYGYENPDDVLSLDLIEVLSDSAPSMKDHVFFAWCGPGANRPSRILKNAFGDTKMWRIPHSDNLNNFIKNQLSK